MIFSYLSFIITNALYCKSEQVINSETLKEKLEIKPPGLFNKKYVVKEGSTFRVSCTFNDENFIGTNHLSWRNENNRKIDGESSSSVFTIGLHEYGTKNKKLSLVFTKIAKRDAGIYKCVGSDSSGRIYQRDIEIIIVDAIEWNEKSSTVGGMLGESLTIDCGAKGNPNPDIRIADKNGEPLNGKEFVVAADEVTVPKLTKNYQNKTIKCLAVQDFLEYHTSTIEEHEIKIDVWFAPEFQSPIIDKYAIVGRSASLICEITASNPPAILFRFFANSNQLNNNDKFEIISNISKQIAILRINKVDEENFGEFKCEVSNIKAKSYQIINLKESSAPGEVHTSLYEVGNRSLTWKIDDDEVDLPTTAYIIEYINKAYIDEITGPNENIEQERLWNSLSMHIKFNKLKDGSYIVDGLQQDTKYMFRIRAENEAGQGDAITIIASTAKHDNKVQSIMANLSLSTNFNFFLSFSIILATILMIN